MIEYLPIDNAQERSRLEAMQRGCIGTTTQYWHPIITHPLTGQDALVVNGDEDKAYFSAGELAALLSQEDAESADWFLEV